MEVVAVEGASEVEVVVSAVEVFPVVEGEDSQGVEVSRAVEECLSPNKGTPGGMPRPHNNRPILGKSRSRRMHERITCW